LKISKPEIIFEDAYMLAVNKPAGWLTIPDRFNDEIPNLTGYLKTVFPDVIPVHRLDRYTSGVNLFAKDAHTHKLLSEAFEGRTIEKYYIAIVDGKPNPETGRIDIPIAESKVTRGKMLVHKRGKPSVTEYKIIRDFKNFSVLYIRIYTGRMHQIRVHLQYLGHPLIVDSLYGNREQFYLSEIKHRKFKLGKFENEKPLLSRQPLHAEKLIFTHPVTGVVTEITAPWPKDIEAVIHQMEKWLH